MKIHFMSKLLPNLPIEDLTVDNDYLGIIDKGQIIKTFLETNTEEFSQIKMFSLYGEWGSGKSTLMKYLQKELKGSFNTFFFEAWEFESDSNLSLSLLEFLTTESQDSTEEAFGEIINTATKLFKGFVKSTKVSFSLGLAKVRIDGDKIVEAVEEESEETFLQLKKKFKTEFIRWEDFITKGDNPNYNVVFVDDLDRCEPENVLNLLSALKLFFTYGEKTIFFCGVDKKAVNEAVKTKYGDVVKANEYLEKVFDISFTMPEHDNLLKLVTLFFKDKEVSKSLSDFLRDLNFTNPRRVKKLLNKFLILKTIKQNINVNSKYYSSFPDFYTDESGNYLETILTLHFIILHEFFPLKYVDLLDFKKKESNFRDVYAGGSIDNQRVQISQKVKSNISDKPFSSIKGKNLNGNFADYSFALVPNNPVGLTSSSFRIDLFDSFKVEREDIEYKFVLHLANNLNIFNHSNYFSDCSMIDLKRLIKDVL